VKNAEDEFVAVGIIVKEFGLRGEVKVRPEAGLFYDIQEFQRFTVFVKGGPKKLEIESVRPAGHHILIFKFKGIDDRDAAEQLKRLVLYVKKSELKELPEDEFYYFQLQGLTVKTLDGKIVGKVIDIMPMPASDILQVVSDDGREVLIPALTVFIKKIDLDKKEILVDIPEGLEQ